jgi:hypothetical protein
MASADVGVVQIDKDNHKQRGGNRFDISVTFSEDAPSLARVGILIRQREGERFLGASMTLHENGKRIADIPVKSVQHRNGAARSVHFMLSRELLQECEIDIGLDKTKPDSPTVGACYRMKVGTFVPPSPIAAPQAGSARPARG